MGSSGERLVVEVRFEIEKDVDGYPKSRDAEALLCEPLDPECSRCVVVSVPFYLRNIAYGDTISAEENRTGGLNFKEVLARGGYSIYRILIHNLSKKDELMAKLLGLDALVEQDGNLIAVAVPPTAKLDVIVDYILTGKKAGWWGAQDGYIAEERP